MQPFDALTYEDKKTIKAYLDVYGGVESAPLRQVFSIWNQNKRTLFKALGNQLRVKIPIAVARDKRLLRNELESIYHPYSIWYQSDADIIKNHPERVSEITHNDFITDVLKFWVKKNYSLRDLFIISRLFLHSNFDDGYISSLNKIDPYHCESFKCTIKNGMKTIKTITKVLQATHYPNIEKFEKWKNTVNKISAIQEAKTNLVISIHPLDYMTMSDNNCGWRSCMSWKNEGCYRAGTLEMMNSNVAVIAYLESFSPFTINLSENEIYNLSNKSWRSLFYVHKDFILSGKSYPYGNDNLTLEILKHISNLVKENLNWNYQFKNQKYLDTQYIKNNFWLRDSFDTNYDKKKKHHSILVYTNGMYNDIVEDPTTNYYCYRNYVNNSKKICLSGPATCICCGEIIRNPRDIYDYEELGRILVCDTCYRHRKCKVCGKTKYEILKFHDFTFCSKECAKDLIYFPDCDNILSKENLISEKKIIFIEQKGMKKEEKDFIIDNFHNLFSRQDENDFYQNLLKRYNENCKIFTMPIRLTRWDFFDIPTWNNGSNDIRSSFYTSYQNKIYRSIVIYDKDKHPEIFKKYQKSKNQICLKDILDWEEGRNNESCFALTNRRRS